MNKDLDDIIQDFASDSKRWLYLKKAIEERIQLQEEDIKYNRAIIKLVDKAVKERENKMIKLN